jgi:hypothetical protein
MGNNRRKSQRLPLWNLEIKLQCMPPRDKLEPRLILWIENINVVSLWNFVVTTLLCVYASREAGRLM